VTGPGGPAEPTSPLTSADVLAQEERLTLPRFTNDEAVELGLIAVSLGQQRELPIVVEISAYDQVLFRAALVGSSVANDSWIARKTRLVSELGHSTLYHRLEHEAAGKTFTEHTGLSEDDYAAHGGGVPIMVRGVGPVGVIVVSGLPHTQDHALAVECLEMLQKRL
jgi:uncharacterized protein (UPF0303 family)